MSIVYFIYQEWTAHHQGTSNLARSQLFYQDIMDYWKQGCISNLHQSSVCIILDTSNYRLSSHYFPQNQGFEYVPRNQYQKDHQFNCSLYTALQGLWMLEFPEPL